MCLCVCGGGGGGGVRCGRDKQMEYEGGINKTMESKTEKKQ